LAILLCPGLRTESLPFDFAPLEYLSEVAAIGFPFGITLRPEGPHVQILRGFKGNIVTRRGLEELSALAPPGYETSFNAPPGLSGAPLLSLDSEIPTVRGMMIRENTAQLGERTMTLGVALDIENLLCLDSRLVGGSVAEELFHRRRTVRPDGTP
jgi:hypothetical protein